MDIIPSTAHKLLTSDTTFSKNLLNVNAYSKILKLYGMERITIEEVMDNLDMLQSIFGKIGNFWIMGFRKNFSRFWEAIYLDGVQRRMSNS